MSSQENIKSKWPNLDKGYKLFYGTTKNCDDLRLDPNKPNVWFFGDSFVEYPKDNIWKPVTDKCNLVHHGRGGTGLESQYMQLLACRKLIQPYDRVIICLGHWARDMGKNGSRWISNPSPRVYMQAPADQIQDGKKHGPDAEEVDKLINIYATYNKEIRWPEQGVARYYAYKNLIEDMEFSTPYVTIFEAFETPKARLTKLWLEDEDINYLTDIQKQLPFWNFIHEITPDIEKRKVAPNHFEDQDVHKFWKYYIDSLNKLGLDRI